MVLRLILTIILSQAMKSMINMTSIFFTFFVCKFCMLSFSSELQFSNMPYMVSIFSLSMFRFISFKFLQPVNMFIQFLRLRQPSKFRFNLTKLLQQLKNLLTSERYRHSIMLIFSSFSTKEKSMGIVKFSWAFRKHNLREVIAQF